MTVMAQPNQVRNRVILTIPIFMVNGQSPYVRGFTFFTYHRALCTPQYLSIGAFTAFPVWMTFSNIGYVSPNCLAWFTAEKLTAFGLCLILKVLIGFPTTDIASDRQTSSLALIIAFFRTILAPSSIKSIWLNVEFLVAYFAIHYRHKLTLTDKEKWVNQ